MNSPSDIDYRRALVLDLPPPDDKTPPLAMRLCEPPLGYARPEQWNGFIPPEMHNGARNESPRRTALLAIVAEAEAQWAALEQPRGGEDG